MLQSHRSFATITIDPLANCPRADACGFGDGLRRLPARNLSYNPLSTKRREPGILVHVHPAPPRIAEASQLQLPRSGPGGQPNESSQLGHLPYKKGTYEDYVGVRGLRQFGKKKWRQHVADVVARLIAALEP